MMWWRSATTSGSLMTRSTRRAVVLGLPLALAGCVTTSRSPVAAHVDPSGQAPVFSETYAEMYGERTDGEFTVPAVNLDRIDPQFLRTTVEYHGPEAPGTVVVDPDLGFLYLVHRDGRAIRYGVGVGREGFAWSGEALVKSKQKWPKWFPTPEAKLRQPELATYAESGFPGGLTNPLGARAHYLWQGSHDTYYRIHGTPEPWTIGGHVSSGCILMINQDVIDLYERVPEGTRVVVRQGTRRDLFG